LVIALGGTTDAAIEEAAAYFCGLGLTRIDLAEGLVAPLRGSALAYKRARVDQMQAHGASHLADHVISDRTAQLGWVVVDVWHTAELLALRAWAKPMCFVWLDDTRRGYSVSLIPVLMWAWQGRLCRLADTVVTRRSDEDGPPFEDYRTALREICFEP